MKFLIAGIAAFIFAFQPAAAQEAPGADDPYIAALDLYKNKSYAEARQAMAPLAEAGDYRAQMVLANLYYYGWGVPVSYETSFKWTQKAANQGDETSIANLAEFYERGIGGVEKDLPRALALLEKAAAKGSQYAKDELTRLRGQLPAAEQPLSAGLDEIKKGKYAAALPIVRHHAEQGDSWAQNTLGWLYQEGHGVTQNDREAVRWYGKSARQGEPDGQYNFGWMHYYGRNPFEYNQYKVAYEWLEKSAAQGHRPAIDFLRQARADEAAFNRQSDADYKRRLKETSGVCRNPRKAIVSRNGKLAREEVICD